MSRCWSGSRLICGWSLLWPGTIYFATHVLRPSQQRTRKFEHWLHVLARKFKQILNVVHEELESQFESLSKRWFWFGVRLMRVNEEGIFSVLIYPSPKTDYIYRHCSAMWGRTEITAAGGVFFGLYWGLENSFSADLTWTSSACDMADFDGVFSISGGCLRKWSSKSRKEPRFFDAIDLVDRGKTRDFSRF